MFPSVEALGVVGRTPYSNSIAGVIPFTSWYGAVGVNVNIPIFNGFLYPATIAGSGGCEPRPVASSLRDLKDRIANDVRTSWLNAITAYNRISVTKQFVDQANLAVNLSETRYNLGLEFDRGAQPGATAANRSADPICRREVPVPDRTVSSAVPDGGAVSGLPIRV